MALFPLPNKQMKGILGKKVGMTQIFDDDGRVVPVTLIEAGPCYVTQKKTSEKDAQHQFSNFVSTENCR